MIKADPAPPEVTAGSDSVTEAVEPRASRSWWRLIALLFAAIYKVLPDRHIAWSDVIIGAVATSLLFTIGKSLISLYLGSSSVTHAYGAAGGLIIVLLWVYYSAQIFLLGAEFTKAYAERHGSHAPGALQPKD